MRCFARGGGESPILAESGGTAGGRALPRQPDNADLPLMFSPGVVHPAPKACAWGAPDEGIPWLPNLLLFCVIPIRFGCN